MVNKIDRDGARPDWVIDQVFDLFVNLDATEEQLDFPVIYSSALRGYASLDSQQHEDNMLCLLDTIIDKVPAPAVDRSSPFQMRISALDYSSYVGAIGIGRITRGSLTPNTPVAITDREGKTRQGRVLQVLGYLGLERKEIDEAHAGDIIAITGIEHLGISDTLSDPKHIEALPALAVDEPTVRMVFQVNDSPFCRTRWQIHH